MKIFTIALSFVFLTLFSGITEQVYAQNLIAEYNFDGNLTDNLGGSTLDKFGPDNDGFDHNNATEQFGSDANGTYWQWTSTLARGGGLWIDADTDISESYSVGVRFSFEITDVSWRKIIDYKNLTSDNGFYFYSGGKLQFYPNNTLGLSTTSNNQVVDIITTRDAVTGTFKAYIIVDNVLYEELDIPDAGEYAVPTLVDGKPRFRFFHDENATSGEATPGGKVYSIKIWDGPITDIVGALDNTWTGALSTDWNIPGNWSKDVVPVITEDVEIPIAANFPVIDLGDNASINNLTVNTGAILTIENGGSLITNGTINNHGTVNIEKSYTDELWKLIGIPVNSATAEMFLGDFLQTYTEASDTWNEVIEPTTLLNPGVGYTIWPTAKGNYTFTGTPNTGDINMPYTYNPGGNPLHYGYNLAGNPYPSSIDWDLLNETYGAVYHYDGTTYTSWNGSGAGSQYILPGEGFMIAPGNAGTLALSNASRTHFSPLKGSNTIQNTIVLHAGNATYMDELYIMFNESATENFDLQYDAWEILTGGDNVGQLFTINNNQNYSIDQRPECDMLALGFACNNDGVFTISNKSSSYEGVLSLEDLKTGTTHNLNQTSYTFNWSASEDAHRFNLHFSPLDVEDVIIEGLSIYTAGSTLFVNSVNEQKYQLNIFNVTGQRVLTDELYGKLNQVPLSLKTGLYMINVSNGTKTATYKVYVK
jgi:hypothetical protein